MKLNRYLSIYFFYRTQFLKDETQERERKKNTLFDKATYTKSHFMLFKHRKQMFAIKNNIICISCAKF